MMAATKSSCWPDLQPELLFLILKRLPSLADRVRVRAVCRPWRTNARLQALPPPHPWLALLDGTFLSIPGGEIHHMPVPDDASYHGCVDNWLMLIDNGGVCSLLNPFSKSMLQLPKQGTICMWNAEPPECPLFYKLVVPSSLDLSPDSLVAALVEDDCSSSTICICQPPIAMRSFAPLDRVRDIIFFNGKLYALVSSKLCVVEIAVNQNCKPEISAVRCIIDSKDYWNSAPPSSTGSYLYTNRYYLVESRGRLLRVKRFIGVLLPLPECNRLQHVRTHWFEVFEAYLTPGSCHWRRLSSLEGQALFVGSYSKSFPAAECGVPKEDCIYFTCDYARSYPAPDPLRDSGAFNMRDGMITPLLPETKVVQRANQGCPTWVFPSD